MNDKLCVSERRTKILEYLSLEKQSTRYELASRFGVSLDTIDRDVMFLSSVAPIYTKQGNGGGIYILPEFRSYKNYLTDTEENLLYDMMLKVSNEEKRILCGIITKFTKNPMQEIAPFKIKTKRRKEMRAVFRNNRIFIYDSFIHKESIKQISGRLWHPEEKAWSIPIEPTNIETLDLLGCEFSDELRGMKRKLTTSEGTGDVLPVMPMPIKVTPYAHQVKAYNFACEIMELAGGDA